MQPDPGTALIFLSFYLVLHVVGLPSFYLNIFVASISIFIITILFGRNNILLIGSIIFVLMLIIRLYKSLPKRRLIYMGLIAAIFIFSVDFIFNNIFEQRHRDRFNVVLGLR